MGEFFNNEREEGNVKLSFTEAIGGRLKLALIIECMETRPVCKWCLRRGIHHVS